MNAIHSTMKKPTPPSMRWYRLAMGLSVAVLTGGMWQVADVDAAELRLRAQCATSGSVVRLGDVAEILATDADKAKALAAVELFPAPPANQPRFLRIRELQDLLVLRGLNLAELQFSGSSQVNIAVASVKATREVVSPLSMSATRKAKRRVAEAIEQYLRDNASGDHAWVVQVELDERQTRLLTDPGRPFSVKGGKAPWVGPQRFELVGDALRDGSRFTVDAQVSVPGNVVVALHAMQRGGVIRAGDVELQEAPADGSAVTVCSLEEVIGRETTRAIPAGKVISADVLRAPLMVRRGEAVTVYALSAGIRIRTTARARDDGSQGDLVAVESLLDRTTFFAVVSGIREVEVYARSARAEPDRK